MNNKDYIKIRFEEAGETCWGKNVGGNLYSIENIPFFTEDVSLHDIVEAIAPSKDEFPCFTKLMGKKTYKLGLKYDKNEAKLQENWETICNHLREHDIHIEGMAPGLCIIAYDISKKYEDIEQIINDCPISLEAI